jgi:hypothetical protein
MTMSNMNGKSITLKEAMEQDIDFSETAAYFYVSYLKRWERVIWVNGYGDLSTQSPDVAGWLGARTWCCHLRTVIVIAE